MPIVIVSEVDEDDDDDMPTVFSRNSRPSSNLSDAFRGKVFFNLFWSVFFIQTCQMIWSADYLVQ